MHTGCILIPLLSRSGTAHYPANMLCMEQGLRQNPMPPPRPAFLRGFTGPKPRHRRLPQLPMSPSKPLLLDLWDQSLHPAVSNAIRCLKAFLEYYFWQWRALLSLALPALDSSVTLRPCSASHCWCNLRRPCASCSNWMLSTKYFSTWNSSPHALRFPWFW